MRKNVWKRFLAAALAAVVMFTSVDCTGLVVNAEGTTKTLGEVVTEHYGINGVELAVLTHADLTANVKTYDVAAPTDLDTKVKLDVANKTITADSYTKADGVTWTPSKVVVVFTGSEEEAVADAGVYKYTGEDTVKEVKVTYEASVEVSAEEQLELLNTTYYLAMATQNMDFYLSDPDLEEYADTIQNHAVPNLDVALSLFDTIKEDEQIKELVEQGEITLPADEAISELEGHIDTVDGSFKLADLYAAYEGADQVVYWAENVSTLIGSFEDTQDAIEALAASDTLVELADLLVDAGDFLDNEDAVKAGKAINDSYIPAFKNYLANDTVQEFDAEYLYASKKDVLVDEPAGDFSLPYRNLQKYQYGSDYVNATTLSIGEPTDVTVEANNRVITVEVSATVIEDNAEVGKNATNTEVVVALGDELDAVKEAAAEKVAAAIEEIDPNGTYGLGERTDVYNLDNYDCIVDAGDIEANGVTDNATISITYAPKTYSVTCTEGGNDVDITDGKEKLPYGYVITLPNATESGKSYEYVADGEVYEQGTDYTVKADVAFSRSMDKEKTSIRVNEIAVEDYAGALTDDAETILKSYAVESDSISARVPDSTWISIIDNTLNVADYNAGNGFTWTPSKVLVKSGSTVEDTITDIQGGKVTISAANYDTVDVEYVLEVTDVDVEDVVNTPYELYLGVQKQLEDLNTLAGYHSGLSQINKSILEMLATQLNDNSKAAIDTVIKEGCNKDNTGALILYTHVLNYKDLGAGTKVNYYYENYEVIKAQINMLADQLAIIAEDENLELLKTNPTFASYADYIDLIPEYADKLGDMKTSYFAPKSEKLLTDAAGYEGLMDVLVAADTNVTQITEINGLHWTKVLSADAPKKASVIVTVQVLDSDNNVTQSTKEEDGKVTFDIETGLTKEQLAEVEGKYPTLLATLNVDQKHYKCTVSYDGKEPTEGLKTGTKVTYTWTPKYYTVKLADETNETLATQKFPYDKQTLTLAAAPEGKRHYYDINGTEVPVEQKNVNASLQLKDNFKALFDDANVTEITISRRTVDVKVEDENKAAVSLVEKLNDTFSTASVTTKATQYNDKKTDRPVALVVRINDNNSKDGGIAKSIVETVKTLLMPSKSNDFANSYVALGGKEIRNGSEISLQAAIDALLDSGIGTKSIDAMFDDAGNTNDNVDLPDGVSPVEEKAAVMKLTRAAKANTSLGAEIIKTTLKIGADEQSAIELDFVMSFFDGEVTSANKKQREELKNSLKKLHRYAEIVGENGNLTIKVKRELSKEVYEMYLLTMILEGKTDLKTVNDVTLTDIVEYEHERFVTDLKNDTITIQTLENTLAKLGQDVDLDANENIAKAINKLLELHKNDGDLEELKINMDEESNKSATAEETYMLTEAKTEYILNAFKKFGVSDSDLKTIKSAIKDEEINGYLDVPVKLEVEGIDSEESDGKYAAVIVNDPRALKGINDVNDASAKIAANAINLVTATELGNTTVAANAMVIMLTDADTVTFAGNAILDLNGKNIQEVKDGSGTVVLVDSTYSNGGKVTKLSKNVKDARQTGEFYTVSEDTKGNLTVELNGGALAEAAVVGTTELKVLAIEIALDLIMNNITSGDMVITGSNEYDIYDVDNNVDDIFKLVDDLKNDQTGLINQVINIVKFGEEDADPKNLEVNGLFGFVNDVLSALTKVDKNKNINAIETLATNAKNGKAIVSYKVETNPVKVNFAVAKGDYITAGIKTENVKDTNAPAKTFKIEFKVAKNGEKLAALCTELASVVKKSDVNVDLDNIEFANKGIEATGASVNTTLHVELLRGTAKTDVRGKSEAAGNHDYAAMIAMIAALGNNGSLSKELKAGVEDYLTDGSIDMLRPAVENITVKQLISAVKNANGMTFAEIAAKMDLKAETARDRVAEFAKVYDDLFRVVYRLATILSNKLGIEGDNSKLGSLRKTEEVKVGDVKFTYYSYVGNYEGSRQISKGFFGIGAKAEGNLYADLSLTLFATDDGDWSEPGGNTPGGNTPSGNTPGGSGGSSDNKKPVEVHLAPSKSSTPSATTGTKTGDANNTVLWISVMGIAVVAVVTVVAMKKRRTK